MAKPGYNGRRPAGLQASKSWRALSEARDPGSIRAWAQRWLEALLVAHYAQVTAYVRSQYLARFAIWCEERAIGTPAEVTPATLERFAKHLHQHRRIDGRPTTANTQQKYLTCLRRFFRWLVEGRHLASDPTEHLLIPRVPLRQLPEPLTVAEIERALNTLDAGKPIELRDRAMWEVMYSTGLRRVELARLKLHDVDPVRGLVFVRQGKGSKDRVVPIGERAVAWVQKYVDELRGEWLRDPREEHLFLNPSGTPATPATLTARAHLLLKRAGIAKPGACHILRHSMATHMLDHGADVRYVQEMLGHKHLNSTQIYTHVSIGKLKAVHTATHPKARLARLDAPTRDAPDADADAPSADAAARGGSAPAALEPTARTGRLESSANDLSSTKG
jgi:integrase/recombinase XerD